MTAVLGCAAARTSNQGERSAGPPRSSPGAPSADALLDAVVFSAVQDAGAPLAGLAVAVVQRGQVLLRRGYGFADVEGRVPMAANAVFRVGSVTKQFTAAEIMRLVRAGRLSLADSVGAYVAGLPPPVAALTVRQLLNQTTGLANYTALPWGMQHWGRERERRAVRVQQLELLPSGAGDREADRSARRARGADRAGRARRADRHGDVRR